MSETQAPALTRKQRVFVEAYLTCWNATEAARRAGYKHPNKQGPALVKLGLIAEAVEARLKEMAMGADEVLARLAEQARGDIRMFLDIAPGQPAQEGAPAEPSGALCGFDFGPGKPLHLLKKITLSDRGNISVEMYDAQAALQLIGRHLKLFTDRIEVDDWREEARKHGVDPEDLITRIASQMGDRRSGSGSVEESPNPGRPGDVGEAAQ